MFRQFKGGKFILRHSVDAIVSPAKNAELINVPFGLWTWVGLSAAAMQRFCQITLTTCFFQLL